MFNSEERVRAINALTEYVLDLENFKQKIKNLERDGEEILKYLKSFHEKIEAKTAERLGLRPNYEGESSVSSPVLKQLAEQKIPERRTKKFVSTKEAAKISPWNKIETNALLEDSSLIVRADVPSFEAWKNLQSNIQSDTCGTVLSHCGNKIRTKVFYAGSNPFEINECFNAGIVDCIYPSPGQKEIKSLPSIVWRAAQSYASNKKANSIFLQFYNVFPDWEMSYSLNKRHKGMRFIVMGVAKATRTHPADRGEYIHPTIEELVPIRGQQVIDMYDKIYERSRNNYRVNGNDGETLIVSAFDKETPTNEEAIVQRWLERIYNLEDVPFTKATKEFIDSKKEVPHPEDEAQRMIEERDAEKVKDSVQMMLGEGSESDLPTK